MALFDGLALLGLIGAARQLFKEATGYKAPANARIDWEKVNEDKKYNLSSKEVQRRWNSGYYHTTEPMKMFDLKKYNEDVLTGISPDELERRRKAGVYGAVKPMGHDHRKNFSLEGLPMDYVLDVERYEYTRRNYPQWFSYRLIDGSYGYRVDPSVYRQYM